MRWFLYNFSKISNFKNKYRADLQLVLTVESKSDIEAVFRSSELISIEHSVKIHNCTTTPLIYLV